MRGYSACSHYQCPSPQFPSTKQTKKETAMSNYHKLYTPEDSAVVFIDHQPQMLFGVARSEEHTSELQSHHDLVCRLLLEKKKGDFDVAEKWYHAAHPKKPDDIIVLD